jgi:hypothetical protein
MEDGKATSFKRSNMELFRGEIHGYTQPGLLKDSRGNRSEVRRASGERSPVAAIRKGA